jgi:hypothetical protein
MSVIGRPGNGIPFLFLGVPGEDLPVTVETLQPCNTRLLVPASPSQTVPEDPLRQCQRLPTLRASPHFEKQSCGEAAE